MLVVKIIGGLGNQLFQYAFGKAVEAKSGVKVYFDVEDFKENYKLRNISLNHFNVSLNEANQKDIKRLKSTFNKVLFKIYRLTNGLIVNGGQLSYYSENGLSFDRTVFTMIHDDLYLNGYWQSEKYFDEIKDTIRSSFKIITPPSIANKKLIDHICSSQSISVHIRRGDYITNPSAAKIYPVCSVEYYQNAINFVAEKCDNPKFFVFSDDINWAKNNLKIGHDVTFVDENSGDKNYEDLRLMLNCKHNIIANSTFSWWGAWLNNNDDKIVVAPKKWFNDGFYTASTLVPSNWVRL